MAKNGLKPEIRFAGFTEDWEQRKLGGVTDRVQGNDGRMGLPTLTISAANGWLDQKDRFYDNIAGNEQKNYTLLKKGQLSYNHGNSKLAKYGVIFELQNYDEALVPRVYHSFKAKENVAPSFIEYLFATKRPDKELGKLISSGARMDGLLNISFDDFMSIEIPVPTIKEQIKISSFFRTLDNLIPLHQRKYDKLIDFKKAMLEKMFPKDGADVPEIRFAGFAGAWERRKLDEQVLFYSGLTYSPSDVVEGHGTLVLRSSNVHGGEIVNADNVYVSSKAVNSDNVQVGDIVVVVRNGSKSLIGKHAQIKETMNNTVIGAFMTGIRYKQADFINALLSTPQFYSEIKKNLGATINQITTGTFREMQFHFPNTVEQKYIGDFFRHLDHLITLHQQELEKLKNIKKSLLGKMFV